MARVRSETNGTVAAANFSPVEICGEEGVGDGAAFAEVDAGAGVAEGEGDGEGLLLAEDTTLGGSR
jgi:hypothetical protein